MMKKNLHLLFLILSCFMFGQVGIGTTSLDDSEVLKIVASNKGILLPNVNLTDLLQASPVTNPANTLLVYNTNITTGKGFYFWENSKWNPLLNTTNIYKFLGIIRSSTTISTGGVNDATANGGVSYTLGEAPASHEWQQIPGLIATIDIFAPLNTTSITIGGISQINSAAAENTFMTYAIGLFVDDKLTAVRNFIISGNFDCLFNDFNEFFNLSNLSVGSHTIQLRETLRVNDVATQSITFGSKHSACTNLTNSMDRSIMNIQISEK